MCGGASRLSLLVLLCVFPPSGPSHQPLSRSSAVLADRVLHLVSLSTVPCSHPWVGLILHHLAAIDCPGIVSGVLQEYLLHSRILPHVQAETELTFCYLAKTMHYVQKPNGSWRTFRGVKPSFGLGQLFRMASTDLWASAFCLFLGR